MNLGITGRRDAGNGQNGPFVICGWTVQGDDREIFQGKGDILVKYRASGQLGAVASGADDSGPDGFLSQNKIVAETASTDGLSQNRANVPEGIPGNFPGNAVSHTAGEGKGQLFCG